MALPQEVHFLVCTEDPMNRKCSTVFQIQHNNNREAPREIQTSEEGLPTHIRHPAGRKVSLYLETAALHLGTTSRTHLSGPHLF